MKALLYNYYIDYTHHDKTRLIILCLLHELRVISNKQLVIFLNFEEVIPKRTVESNLTYLRKKELIQSARMGVNAYHYLTKEGHHYIGGYYTFPKVPEYNLQHHLQINDYLLKMLEICDSHPHLNAVISERRQVYETKDGAKNAKGRKYFVADFIFRFRDKEQADINWSFEIELTMKTKRRYREGIFPKYITELKRREDARLIYVTPSPVIKEELEKFKAYFIYKKGDEYSEVFERLHVFSAEEFESQMMTLVAKDPFINWKQEEEH